MTPNHNQLNPFGKNPENGKEGPIDYVPGMRGEKNQGPSYVNSEEIPHHQQVADAIEARKAELETQKELSPEQMREEIARVTEEVARQRDEEAERMAA